MGFLLFFVHIFSSFVQTANPNSKAQGRVFSAVFIFKDFAGSFIYFLFRGQMR